jgi:hypothetical protein
MRKRTYEDRSFSQGDSNSKLYRENWERIFGKKCPCGKPLSETHDDEHPGECCDCFDRSLREELKKP